MNPNLYLENLKKYVDHLLTEKKSRLLFTPNLKNDYEKNFFDYKFDKKELYENLSSEIKNCFKCPLASERKKVVIGNGNTLSPLIMFIGDYPKQEEENENFPISGATQTMFQNILKKVLQIKQQDIYITNCLKCKNLYGNKKAIEFAEICKNFLIRTIDILKPRLICTFGTIATKIILGNSINENFKITDIRGSIYSYKNIPVIPTLHLKACILKPSLKKFVLFDMQNLKKQIDKLNG
jgi:DNA polymerase